MKLSHPIVIKSLGLLGSWVMRLWAATLDIRFEIDDETTDPRRAERPHLYLFWHEMMFFPAYTHAKERIPILVSRHRDGELIAQVIRMFRGRVVRGSTHQGGAAALRKMIRIGRDCHLAITPDGPRGPRRIVQPGAIYLASRCGMPVVPVGFAYSRCWRFGSWDSIAVPRPWQSARCVVGRPMLIPGEVRKAEIEDCRLWVQGAMDDVQRRAEALVAASNGNGNGHVRRAAAAPPGTPLIWRSPAVAPAAALIPAWDCNTAAASGSDRPAPEIALAQ